MLLIALRDLQWRRRRFLIAVLATSLVFALTLLLSGAGNGLRNEASRTVQAFDADAWFVAEGASGPFTTSSLLPESTAADVAALDGVERADPFLFMRSTSDTSNPTDVNVIGFRAGGLGTPEADEGRAPRRRGEALVDAGLGSDVGEDIEIGGQTFLVSGVADDISFNFGVATVYVPLADVQAMAFEGQPLATSVVTRGVPSATADGLTQLTNARGRVGHAPAHGERAADDRLHQRPALAHRRGDHRIDRVPLGARADAGLRGDEGHGCGQRAAPRRARAPGVGALGCVRGRRRSVLARPLKAGFPFSIDDPVVGVRDPARGGARWSGSWPAWPGCGGPSGSTRPSRSGWLMAAVADPVADRGVLSVEDLTMEYSSGGYAVRPIDGLDLDVSSGAARPAARCERLRQDHAALGASPASSRPTAGTIRFGDIDVTRLAGRELTEYRRRTVGIVFQAFNLVPSLTARENVQAPLLVAGVRGRRCRDRADELLDGVGLDRPDGRTGPATCPAGSSSASPSPGRSPTIRRCSSPTSPPPTSTTCRSTACSALLRELAAPGRVVVVATHDDRLLPLADRVVELTPRSPSPPRRSPPASPSSAGEVLFRQGDPGDLVYVVEEGEVDLVRALADGGEELLDAVRTGPLLRRARPALRPAPLGHREGAHPSGRQRFAGVRVPRPTPVRRERRRGPELTSGELRSACPRARRRSDRAPRGSRSR